MRVKGFSLIQCLILVGIISTISLVSISRIHEFQCGMVHQFYATAIETQLSALLDHSYQSVINNNGCEYDELFYYPNGTVNKAQTITCNAQTLILHLGNGNIE